MRWAAIGALLALAACTHHSSTATPRSSPAPPIGSTGPFRPGDMASIELTPRDAPAGLGYVAAFSGDQDIVAFARDATEEQHLADDGFLSANGAVFVPADRVDGGKLTPRDPIVQSTVVVFSRGVGASSTLRRYVADVRDRQLTGATAGVVPPLGDEAYRLDGTNADGSAVTVFAWRRGNLVLVVLGTSFPSAHTLRLATLVDERAVTAEPAAP